MIGSRAEPPSATRRTAATKSVDVADAVLEQVADSLGRVRQELHREPDLDVLRQHEHPNFRMVRRGSRAPRASPRRCASAAGGCRRSRRPADCCGPPAAAPRRRRTARRPRTRPRSADGSGLRAEGHCPRRSLPAWNLRSDARAAAGRAPDPQPAAECLDAVGEPAQTAAAFGVRAAEPSSITSTKTFRFRATSTVADGRVRVLADVGEALADHVVRGDLERLGSRPPARLAGAPEPVRARRRTRAQPPVRDR